MQFPPSPGRTQQTLTCFLRCCNRAGSGGGGTAGKSKSSTQLSFQRHVPKFLQPYAHMLGQKRQDEDEPQMLMEQKLRAEQDDDEEDDKAAEEEAIQRALEENPELAAQLGEEYMHKVHAANEKGLGNKAFADKDYQTAAKHFTTCIELDPKNAVYYSNRSAAAANLSRFEDALNDALTVIKLKPGWVKGHARAAAAYMGLQLYSEAKEAYEKAVKLEPDDQALQRELNKATGLELQHMRDRKHVFKKGRVGSTNSSGPEQKQQRRQEPSKWQGDGKAAAGAGSKAKQTTKLSFVVDEEEEEQ
eukprot:GHUV01026627.1.p1 GENE.GHUV01026627.1~~GHUV01026627.1.p1  ORF type:complete len:303 (+),score=121.29 GHUV01026627.1:33-941(+)